MGDYESIASSLDIHRHSDNPEWLRKRSMTSWICIMYGLMIGMEYSSIMTSLFYYLEHDLKIQNKNMWYSLIMCVTALSSAINGLLVGRLFDKTRRLKTVMLIFTSISLIGNLLYTFHQSVWFLVCGRFLCGLCDAAQPVITGKDISRIQFKL